MNRKTVVFLISAAIVLMAAPAAFSADGAAIFKTKCASCHGPDGTGLTAMGKAMKLRDLGSADVQKQSAADVHGVIANGKGKMPAYKGKLTDAQIDALVTQIRTFAKK